ncbi:protein PYR1-3 [Anaerolineaceae bacterium]|nr:protein PYR1-3 [Anaerolineaceae bacterium]
MQLCCAIPSAAQPTPQPAMRASPSSTPATGRASIPRRLCWIPFTIREELGQLDGLTVTLVGDLKHGRTVHSLVQLLALHNVRLNYVSPESLRLPAALQAQLAAAGVEQRQQPDLAAVLPETDVLYVTRVQKERFTDMAEYERIQGSYVINAALLRSARERMIVMHPLPRVGEIDMEVDNDPRAAYFRQMEYGMFVRMALLALVLGKA